MGAIGEGCSVQMFAVCRRVSPCLRLLMMSAAFAVVPGGAAAAAKLTLADLQVADDHTRIVFESPERIRFSLTSLRNPARLALDLQGVELNAVLSALAGKVPTAHPYLGRIRITQLRRDVVRVQFELKAHVEPRVS